MAVRFTLDYAALYAWEALGHYIPPLNTSVVAGGPLLVQAPTANESLVCGFYGNSTGTLNYFALIKAAGSQSCQIRAYTGSGSVVTSSSFDLPPGLHFPSLEFDQAAGQVRARLDGAIVASIAFTPAPGTLGDRSFQFGGYGELPGIIDGTVERWRMWTAILTEAELRAEFRSMGPVRRAGLVHDWPLQGWPDFSDDTVPGQPGIAQNPAAPVVDSPNIVIPPTFAAAPVFYDLGQTATPGAQAVTVPQWATHVGIHITASDNAAAPYGDLSSLVSNLVGAFTRGNAPVTALAAGGWVATAEVTSWAAGRTFTPTFTEGSPLAGANAWLYFLQDTAGATARGTGQATGTGGTTPGTASAAGVANGLAAAVDMHLGASSGVYPSNESGWDSRGTAQTTGAFGYFSGTRLRTKSTPGGTETATTQDTLGSVITLATWAPKALTNTATLNAQAANATLQASATHPVRGTLAAQAANATLAAAGAVAFPARTGTLNVQAQAATLASQAAHGVRGTLAAQAANATLTAAAGARVAASLGLTAANATLAAAGAVGSPPVSGALNVQAANATLAALGVVPLAGRLQAQAASATLQAQAAHPVRGTLAVQGADATLVAEGVVVSPAVSAQLNVQAQAATLTAFGAVVNPDTRTASLVKTADNATLQAQAAHPVRGGAALIAADATLAAQAVHAVQGALAAQAANATLAALGIVPTAGRLTVLAADATLAAGGWVGDAIVARLDVQAGDAGLLARGVVAESWKPDPARTVRVGAESRTVRIAAENRTVKVV